jgi:hypothetical protein
VLAEEVFPGRRALRPKFSDSLQPPGYVEEARRTRLLAREAARTSLGQKRAVARPQFSESEIGGSSTSGNRLTLSTPTHDGSSLSTSRKALSADPAHIKNDDLLSRAVVG